MSDSAELLQFRDAFAAEAEQLLSTASAQALALETAARENTSQARTVRELFRAVHTIKGLAAMVSVEPIVAISHLLEDMLRDADQRGLRLPQEAVDTLLLALDAIQQRVRSVAAGQAVAEPPAALLSQLALPRGNAITAQARVDTEFVFTLDDTVAAHLSASDRQQLVQGVLEGKRALRIDFAPSPMLAAEGHSITSLRERLAAIAEIVKVVPMTDKSAPSGLSFVLFLLSEATDDKIQETVIVPLPPPQQIVSLRAGAEENEESPQRAEAVRVDVSRLDAALDGLSDLVITRFRLARAVQTLKEQGADVREISEVVNENAKQLRKLRAAVLRVRTVSLDELFARMRLVVRNVTRASNKRVRLELESGGTEVDKSVAERVFPALIHLARNAIDHGLELPHERERSGKPGEGVLRITCRQTASTQIEIVIEDDGRGINAQKVCQRAGVPTVTSSDALLDILCTPGFSTRDEVDATSGRGMGMDIVKKSVVEQLGGALLLETEVGKGTRFILRVPLSIAIVDAFVFDCAKQRFVTPSALIEEAIDLPNITRPSGGDVGVIVYRGQTMPFVELAQKLQVPHAVHSKQAFIVRQKGEKVALGVEKIITQQEIVVRPMDDKLVKSPGINGACDLGDGVPTLVLDLVRIAQGVERVTA